MKKKTALGWAPVKDWLQCCGFCLFTAQPWMSFTPAVQQSDKNWPPSSTVDFPRSPNTSIKAHVWEKPGGIYPLWLGVNIKSLSTVWVKVEAPGGARRDLIRPIMTNHNQKSIFFKSTFGEKAALSRVTDLFSQKWVMCLWKQHTAACFTALRTHCFFFLRSIYHSVQLIIKLFLFLPRHTLLFFDCMKYSLFRQILRQSLINC